MSPKPFLKSLGMQFNARPAQLNTRFYKSLSEEQQQRTEDIWARSSMGFGSNTELYAVPESLKQATRLYSLDAARYEATLHWFRKVAIHTGPERIFEIGAGAGITSGYLKNHSDCLEIAGIERHANLANIARESFASDIQVGDYLQVEGDSSYDLVICDFGFDVEDLPPSNRPHSVAKVGGHQYCPGCAEDMGETLKPYFEKWFSWMNETGKLAVAGRFANVGMVYGALVAAEATGLRPIEGLCDMLRITQNGMKQSFPALAFERGEMEATLESAAFLYSL